RGRVRRRALDVSRPGPDRDQAQGLQSRCHRDRGPRDGFHDAGPWHGIRHRGPGQGHDRRARTGGAARPPTRPPRRPRAPRRPRRLNFLGDLMATNAAHETETHPITDEVAGFAISTKATDIPKNAAHLAKRSVIDGIGLAFAGARAECGHIAQRYLAGLGLSEEHGCTVIGTTMKVPARFAAFANGLAIHADDYDDTQLAVAKDRVYGLLTHPTAPALPPVLAIGERDHRSGLDVMLAYQIGVEVECKVAEAIMPRHYQHGFHSTATCGSIGAAAAAARLLGLDRDAMRRAISIGATQAGGLRENFGTMTKPFHAGRAAENGMLAAEIAALGFTASPNG